MFITFFLILIQAGWIALMFLKVAGNSTLISDAFKLLSIAMALYVISKADVPAYRMGWILVILVFPLFGGLLYLLLGEKRPARYLRRRLNKGKKNHDQTAVQSPEVFEEMKARWPRAAGCASYVSNIARYPVWKNTCVTYHALGEYQYADMLEELQKAGVPVITPAGGLGCHINVMEFLDHVPQAQYPAGALAAALYIAGGVRGMERGTLSEQREPDGSEIMANMELLRLAMPRRVFTLSQVQYAIDRIVWLYRHRKLIGGLRFVEEPAILRFFYGRLEPTSDWQQKLVAQFRKDFGDSL